MRIIYRGLSTINANRLFNAIKGLNHAINEFATFPHECDLKVNLDTCSANFFISDSDQTLAFTLINTMLFPGKEYHEMVRNILEPVRDDGYLNIVYKGDLILQLELIKRCQIENILDKVSPKRDAKSLK